MIDKGMSQEQIWEKGWDGHEKAQLKRMARLSFQEKIKWLEEAQEQLISLTRKETKRVKKN
jgi:hypothetical protein